MSAYMPKGPGGLRGGPKIFSGGSAFQSLGRGSQNISLGGIGSQNISLGGMGGDKAPNFFEKSHSNLAGGGVCSIKILR